MRQRKAEEKPRNIYKPYSGKFVGFVASELAILAILSAMKIEGAMGKAPLISLFERRGNKMNESIKALQEEIYELRRRIDELRRANSAYFVLWTEVGNTDYYDRYYIPIGYITEDLAIETVRKELESNGVVDAGYKEVSKHEYDLYKEWGYISKVLTDLRVLKAVKKSESEIVKSATEELKERVKTIKKVLGLTYGWENILPERRVDYDEEEEM